MRVYGVAWWDYYYPMSDNVRKMFSNDRDAYLYLDEVKQEHEKADSVYDRYDVFVYEVD